MNQTRVLDENVAKAVLGEAEDKVKVAKCFYWVTKASLVLSQTHDIWWTTWCDVPINTCGQHTIRPLLTSSCSRIVYKATFDKTDSAFEYQIYKEAEKKNNPLVMVYRLSSHKDLVSLVILLFINFGVNSSCPLDYSEGG
ncbi:hypothetical protein MKX03_023104 [Papaver bracteatum]|nr:hypothetical protein MKX03_023104 [Papaver bracteatum]